MQKNLVAVLVLMLTILVVCAAAAYADEAPDLTASCTLKPSSVDLKVTRLADRDYTTAWKSRLSREPNLEIISPEGVYGLYVCWSDIPSAWVVEEYLDDAWQIVYESGAEGYAHQYIPLSGQTHLRLRATVRKNIQMTVNELFVLGEGDVPDYVQIWQPTFDACDILVLSAHPDDEVLYMGGTIPYYAGELQKRVVVAYMTFGNTTRRAELLNGLWTCGVRNYPVLGTFYDKYSTKLDSAYSIWGKSKVYAFLTSLIRQVKPSVIVTHDINGEYGHGAHRLCANATLVCVENAANPAQHPDSVSLYGTWQTSKVYLHLYTENPIVMDWRVPLSAFDGATAFDMAEAAYECHKTQHRYSFFVEPEDSQYSCFRFGLAMTQVGLDAVGGDFLENIPPREDIVSE